MRKLLFTFCLALLSLMSMARHEQPYSVKNISPDLLQGANVVVRKAHTAFDVQSRSRAQMQVQKVITVLNKEGSASTPFYLYYDTHRHITELSAIIYDAAGNQIKHIHAEDFSDFAAVQDAPLFAQNRFKVLAHSAENYPYTIAYRYSLDIDGLYRYPGWNPVSGEGVAVESAEFQISLPDSLGFHYQSYQLDDGPHIAHRQKVKTYRWQIKKQKPVMIEPLGPEFYEITPTLQLFPKHFSYEGSKGSGESWENFGYWISGLLEGNNSLPEATRREVLALTSETSELRLKIGQMMDYMHSRFRYINVPLGIGTYRPVSPAQLEEAGYGDSKAFANYMRSLLQAAGISSHYALVNAGKFATPIDRSTPGAQFNHAFLVVPLANDTLWIDCTNTHRPFVFPGYFLSDRDVLLVTENGGKMIRTPAFSAEENLQARHANIRIDADGQGQGEVITRFSGLQYEHLSPILLLSAEQQEEAIYRKTDLPSFTLEAFSYFARQTQEPLLEEKLVLKLPDFAIASGKRFSFNPNLLNQMDGLPPLLSARKNTVEVKREFLDIDTLLYTIPEAMQVSSLPGEVIIHSKFGEYKMTVKQSGKQLQYTRFLQTKKGFFPAEAYADLLEFYEDIVRADQRKVILERLSTDHKKEELSRASRLQ